MDRSFEPPYSALVHRWDRIQALHQELAASDDTRKLAVDQLVEFMQPILAPSLEGLATTRATGMISYSTVWQIFSPGEIVVTKLWGVDALCRVVKYKRNSGWFIDVEYIDWDGGECGFARTRVTIPKFYGLSRIASLPVFPLSFAQNPDRIKEKMAARGRRFQAFRGYQFVNYNGVKLPLDDEGQNEPVTGRVIIDSYAYYRSNDIVKPTLLALGGNEGTDPEASEEQPGADEDADEDAGEKADEEADEDASNGDAENDDAEDGDVEGGDADAEDSPNAETDEETVTAPSETSSNKRVENLTPLSDEHCLLTVPWMIGFDLDKKKWGEHFRAVVLYSVD